MHLKLGVSKALVTGHSHRYLTPMVVPLQPHRSAPPWEINRGFGSFRNERSATQVMETSVIKTLALSLIIIDSNAFTASIRPETRAAAGFADGFELFPVCGQFRIVCPDNRQGRPVGRQGARFTARDTGGTAFGVLTAQG